MCSKTKSMWTFTLWSWNILYGGFTWQCCLQVAYYSFLAAPLARYCFHYHSISLHAPYSILHFTFSTQNILQFLNLQIILQGVSLAWFLNLTPSLVVDLNVSLILTVLETMCVNHKNVFLVQILVCQALVDLELDVLLDLLAIPSVDVNLDWFPTLTPSLVANLNVFEILIVLEEITSVKTKSKILPFCPVNISIILNFYFQVCLETWSLWSQSLWSRNKMYVKQTWQSHL